MQIGKLRHRVTIQKQINSQTDYGAVVTKWRNIATVWAEVKPLSGREYFSAQQVQSEVTTQIWIRYQKGIEPTMRVVHNDKHYEILAVLNHNGLGISLQLMCKELFNG